MELKVVVESVQALDCTDEIETPFGNPCDPVFGEADMYAIVTIAGQEFDSVAATINDNDNISPNWPFTKAVDTSAGSVPVKVEIYDNDSGPLSTRGDDDALDVTSSDSDRAADVSVNLTGCSSGAANAITGDSSGRCEVAPADPPITTQGNSGNDNAKVSFRIELSAPASLPGTNVRCMHSPIWPAAGQAVTITVESLDANNTAEQANTIEIFVDNRSAPVRTANAVNTLTFTTPARSTGTMNYACRLIDEDGTVSTGWRAVRVGPPENLAPGLDAPVPILMAEAQAGAIDIMFVADRIDFPTGPTNMTFLSDVHNLIRDGYYAKKRTETFWLKHQKQMNFWVSPVGGLGEGVADGCDHEVPYRANFVDVYSLIHDRAFRDCAPSGDRIFSIQATRSDAHEVVMHETGHRPFGLADEYCCDGGYYQTDVAPNVYEEPEDCAADLSNLPGNTCREFEEEVDWWVDTDWSVSDRGSNHLMVDDGNHTTDGADLRRINMIFDGCAAASC